MKDFDGLEFDEHRAALRKELTKRALRIASQRHKDGFMMGRDQSYEVAANQMIDELANELAQAREAGNCHLVDKIIILKGDVKMVLGELVPG